MQSENVQGTVVVRMMWCDQTKSVRTWKYWFWVIVKQRKQYSLFLIVFANTEMFISLKLIVLFYLSFQQKVALQMMYTINLKNKKLILPFFRLILLDHITYMYNTKFQTYVQCQWIHRAKYCLVFLSGWLVFHTNLAFFFFFLFKKSSTWAAFHIFMSKSFKIIIIPFCS